jgi:hypothetical protein
MLNLGFVFIEVSSSVKFCWEVQARRSDENHGASLVAVEPMTSVLAATEVAQGLTAELHRSCRDCLCSA